MSWIGKAQQGIQKVDYIHCNQSEDMRLELNGGMVEDIVPSNWCGVVDLPLFSAVQPFQYLFPILHAVIGLVMNDP